MPAYNPPVASGHSALSSTRCVYRVPSGDYDIAALPTEKLLRISIVGFWDGSTTMQFATELYAAIARLGTRPGEHLILADITRAAIQSQDVMNQLTTMVARRASRSRRLALLSMGNGVRLQARRLLNARDNLAMFDNEGEALAWLARSAYLGSERR